ncbi:MAG: hypothetical protein D8M57_19035 [Candidatus Scalindua sp. AMX11]|nr:MAG: hypothetical protein DWQ00_08260 [Candidatus Scalindua sp.]NOG85226.1 hypothetical protein [Planctomycetota bacterium]RZV62041.1 MAG: hypothetical protein EX341_18640 [Candidatus Scalindua sp. SCAELEC01]TDE63290.1 MAG: hypothetical protein D8M57_19035 [Candidatus Scalindua sp. AMX11]GJQ57388.1 MAG: hypothetical protein SCALA701_01890 [Candidatus Scalindua sp.]
MTSALECNISRLINPERISGSDKYKRDMLILLWNTGFLHELRGCKNREYQVFFRQQTGKQYNVEYILKPIWFSVLPENQMLVKVSPDAEDFTRSNLFRILSENHYEMSIKDFKSFYALRS